MRIEMFLIVSLYGKLLLLLSNVLSLEQTVYGDKWQGF